jgi:hypothetical protein
VFGVRTGRDQGAARWIITRVSRMLVRLLYGGAVRDVNVPFRLMRADGLASFVDRIPGDTFAPNVVIAGVLSRRGLNIANLPVKFSGRQTGQVSIVRLKLWKAALRSALQLVRCRAI